MKFWQGRTNLLFASLLAWVVGTWLQLLQTSLYNIKIYVLFLAVAGVFIDCVAINSRAKDTAIQRQYFRIFNPIFLLLACGFAAFGLTGIRANLYASQQLLPAYEGRDIELVGVVSAMPHTNEMGTRFELNVESAQLLLTVDQVQSKQVAKHVIELPSKISLSWYGGVFGASFGAVETAGDLATLQRKSMPILPGERWQMTVRLKAPHGNSNPGGFDFELWLWEQGIQATGYARTSAKDAVPVRLAQTWWYPVEQLRYKVRDAIFERMASRQLSTDSFKNSSEAGIVAALVTGDQQSIDRADWDVFRATGVAHLMSISGLHITMFAWAAVLVVGVLYRRSNRLCLAFPAINAALLGGLLLATGYAVFSGWGVPSQRTILMLATVTLLKLLGKRWPWPTVWMLACAVVVVVDPWALLQAGFWLSFVAVGVLFATDISMDTSRLSVADQTDRNTSAKLSLIAIIKTKLWLIGREQFIITLVLAPLTLLLFGQISVVGLLANAFAIPWVTLVVTPLAMLGTVVSPIWDMAGLAVHVLSRFLGLLAGLPFATVTMAVPHLLVSVIAVIGAALLVLPWPWQLRFLGLPLLLPVILWQAPRPADGQFEMMAADVGQGNAVVIRTAKHTLVYDAGPRYSVDSDAGHRVLVPLLRATNENVDAVMLSHRDSDHSGGVKSVLAMHPKATFISSIENDHELQAFRSAKRCMAGQSWQWDGVDFAVLHPSESDFELQQKSNAMSCVLRISTASASVLLAGDIEQAQEAKIASENDKEQLKSTLLLVPHHGSKTSSSSVFLDAVQPQLAVVQAGYRNRFGHPAADVLKRYSENGIKVVNTARCGAVLWSSVSPIEARCHREIAKRYWHHQVP